MSVVILNVLCEGDTEEKFAKEVLKPYFKGFGIIVKHRSLVTSWKKEKDGRKKAIRGGMISYQQAKRDLFMWQRETACHRGDEIDYFTTMFDFYALPDDFPGYAEAQTIADPYLKVHKLEDEFSKDMSMQNFIPYIQLHEFEALLFCDIEKLDEEYPKCSREIRDLEKVLISFSGNPELIDGGFATAPGKRIKGAIEKTGKYRYDKPKSGAAVTSAIGIEKLMSKCIHFKNWIEAIRKVAGNQTIHND